jgi:C-terminal processing protease CtpA/Prc
LRKTPFKVSDSTFAVAPSLHPYRKHIKLGFLYNLGLFFLTTKKTDGYYHYSRYEEHLFNPKKRNHFNGKLYVLIAGPSFSASTLFCNALKGQDNVKLLGEETGGGWYGNNGIFIPDIVLPVTKLRVRLPLFRIVQFNHVEKTGSGIAPDIYVPITMQNVNMRIDRKMQAVKEIIKESQKK